MKSAFDILVFSVLSAKRRRPCDALLLPSKLACFDAAQNLWREDSFALVWWRAASAVQAGAQDVQILDVRPLI
ncbi:hypothetical protein [Polaromonas sp. A23]|uniref:hypothetical protein n=1 Tax=Polaromonas sp. A23 TaxID=1944133 RepID=UPI0011159D5E|nr:hypothetical protein [Polaromonas sp. A23]